MPIHADINVDERRVYTTCSGEITAACFKNYQDNVWRDESLYGFNELFDATQADFSTLNFSDMLTVAEGAAKLNTLAPDSKIAILVTPGKQEEIANFYVAAKGSMPVTSRAMQIFQDRDDALAWLV